MRLTDLKKGEKGMIVSILGGWCVVKRLEELGLTPGTEITMKKSAPFRGPVEISVRGSRLAIGRGVAMKIVVKKKT